MAPAAKLLEFDRHIDVLWAPSARSIAITDYRGSSDSVVWVVDVARPAMLVNVEKVFVQAFARPNSLCVNGHRYFTARNWSSPRTLTFDVRAHDAKSGNDYLAHPDADQERPAGGKRAVMTAGRRLRNAV